MDKILNSSGLYSTEFIEKYGESSPHWNRMGLVAKEQFLRHQMACVLLSNTELLTKRLPDTDLGPKDSKKQRLNEGASTSSGTTSSDDYIKSVIVEEKKYRYQVIEGSSLSDFTQNAMCDKMGIPRMGQRYDICDWKEKKLIEVKVTVDASIYLGKIGEYIRDKNYCSLILVHPENFKIYTIGKQDKMPGENKLTNWLAARATVMSELGQMPAEVRQDKPMYETIFSNNFLNSSIRDWTNMFYQFRDKDFSDVPRFPADDESEHSLKILSIKKLVDGIEDTKQRDTPFMQFHGKTLPPFLKHGFVTEVGNDDKLIDMILKDVEFPNENPIVEFVSWVAKKWRSRTQNFDFITKVELDEVDCLKWVLGIDVKNTVRYDGHEELKQEPTYPVPKLRYSAWLSNMMQRLTKENSNQFVYFHELCREEIDHNTPMPILTELNNKFFKMYSTTGAAKYASELKNFYSRLGGAYSVDKSGKKMSGIVVFPIYSSGIQYNSYKREVNGFVIRGPSHPKKQTDRIPIVTVEIVNENGNPYLPFIKKAHYVRDNQGKLWCFRQNSINKADPAFMAFSNNPTFISVNMIGEMVLSNEHLSADNISKVGLSFFTTFRDWSMERIVENLMMMVLGGSSEEGAMAAIRKIFMLMVSWHRKSDVWGWDEVGLAESLNECLLDRPLALYYAEQTRLFLLELLNREENEMK